MTDRDYVESTVSYLAEKCPDLFGEFTKAFRITEPGEYDWNWLHCQFHNFAEVAARRKAERVLPGSIWKPDFRDTFQDTMTALWSASAIWLRSKVDPMGDPLVSADWWEEHGESKLADLLRGSANNEQ